mgnify:CR=1 FL=1
MKTLAELAALVEGAEIKGDAAAKIADIVHDSREVTEGTLFVAIEGLHVDGHSFIAQAVEKGACAILAVVVEINDAFEQHVAQIIHAVFVECAVFGHEVFEPIEAAAEALVVDFGVGGGAGGKFALQEGEAVVAEVVPCPEAAGFADVFGGAHHFAGVAAAFKQELGFFAVGGVFKIFMPRLEA